MYSEQNENKYNVFYQPTGEDKDDLIETNKFDNLADLETKKVINAVSISVVSNDRVLRKFDLFKKRLKNN